MEGRPAPAAEGNLARTPFAHVLLYVRERKLSGTIAVRSGPVGGELAGESLLAFEGGALAQVKLPKPNDTLGAVLREQGAITDDALHESLARLAAREGLQGEILVAMGACDEAAVERALREQVRRKAVRLFDLQDGPYQYYDQFDMLADFGRTRYPEDVFAVVWRGTRARPDAPAVETVMSRVAGQLLRLRPGADPALFDFGPADSAALDVLRAGHASPEALLAAAPDERVGRAMIYVLIASKQVDLVPAGADAPPPRPVTAPHAVATRAVTNLSFSPPVLPRVLSSDLPGARISAPPAADVSPSSPASRTSSTPPLNPGLPRRASAMLPRRASDSHSALPPELQAKANDAIERIAAMEDENYFQMLGVPQSASVETVKTAFLDLAARWHPDRVPSNVSRLRDLYNRVFSQLNEAHATLVDHTSRGRYLLTVRDGGGTPNAQRKIALHIEAATDVQKAEVCIRTRDFAEAERLTRKALIVNPDDPNTLSVLAHAMLEKSPEAPPAEAEKHLRRAVELAPKHDRAQVLLGTLYKRRNNLVAAAQHFRLAVAANPKNVEAAREVRLAEMRSRPGAQVAPPSPPEKDSDKGGFLSKFLKK